MTILPMMINLTPLEQMSAICDLNVVDDDEGAGEPIDPDPIVPTVGAN
jgi:hypothetical protein